MRWFAGAHTSAAFNELDRHVLSSHGDDTALISEPDGDKRLATCVNRRELLTDSALAAHTLRATLGVERGSRVAFHLPNDVLAVVWIAAAKRLGAPYTAVAAGTASSSLADRLADTGAAVLVTGGSGQAEAVLQALKMMPCEAPTVVMMRGAVACGWFDLSTLQEASREHFHSAEGGALRDGLGDSQLVSALWTSAPPQPVEASHPLFILYTSGSTGKPKGVVHAHGGYLTGLVATSKIVFDLQSARDVLFVVATPGWITGQSYMIAAALLCRVASVLLDGSPVSPPDRFASVISRHRVSVLKAGSTFLRMLMMRANAVPLLAEHSFESLRLGTFCAEPVNEAVHRFAMAHLTPKYINSYWATEHGGIVWSRCHGNIDQPLQPDTRSWPLPWIDDEVLVAAGNGGRRTAVPGEQGEVVIQQSYPYLALTVWSSDGFGTPTWLGDLARWGKYFAGTSYVQGDAAIRHADGAYTFHGRSDEVMNVGGNRIGTEEIESAILLDRTREGSPLRNCAVVGMADHVLGTVPCAFLVLEPGTELSATDEGRIRATVQERVSSVAVPARFVAVPALPETYSGKYMRRLLRSMIAGEPTGDFDALRNPECIQALRAAIVSGEGLHLIARAANYESPVDSASAPTADELALTVLECVHELTGQSDVSVDAPLMDVGLSSLGATRLAAALGKQLGLQLAPTLVFEYSTARAIAAHLHASLTRSNAGAPTPASGSFTQAQTAARRVGITALSAKLPSGLATLQTASCATATGVDAVCTVPAHRWVLPVDAREALSHGVAARAAYGGFTQDVELFDNAVFGVSPAETVAMDPQQRLLLEKGYDVLQDRIADGDALAGASALIGVCVGIEMQDFTQLMLDGPPNVYLATGSSLSVASGRLSFALGLHGPCCAYVTACSASLVGYHAARRGVQIGECQGAVATGVNMMLLPGVSVALGMAGMTSASGSCHTFDTLADGYVRSEACTAAALQNGEAETRNTAGSAVRSDGRSASLTAPNGQVQRALIAAALNDGQTQIDALALNEAHGTGTALGDPIEAGSLVGAVLSAREEALAVGGVKANIGHAEPAAGMTGLLKLALGLLVAQVPPNAQLRRLNNDQ